MTEPPRETRHPKLRRLRTILAWLLLAGFYATRAFGWLTPIQFADSRTGQATIWLAFMVRTFTFHLGIATLLVGLYALAFRLWRPLLASVPLLAVTLGPAALSYLPKDPDPIAGASLKLLSCNLLAGSPAHEHALAYIREAQPDVICFQEYSPVAHELLSRELATDYPHIITGPREDSFGQAVYLKQPPREAKIYPPPLAAPGLDPRRSRGVSEPQIR
jgi:endonuclease/exonuclease/phosphatase (EEP) superfamily protein YafD